METKPKSRRYLLYIRSNRRLVMGLNISQDVIDRYFAPIMHNRRLYYLRIVR